MFVGLHPAHTVFSIELLWFVAKPQSCGMSVQGYRVIGEIHASKFKVRGNTAQLRLKLPGE